MSVRTVEVKQEIERRVCDWCEISKPEEASTFDFKRAQDTEGLEDMRFDIVIDLCHECSVIVYNSFKKRKRVRKPAASTAGSEAAPPLEE